MTQGLHAAGAGIPQRLVGLTTHLVASGLDFVLFIESQTIRAEGLYRWYDCFIIQTIKIKEKTVRK